MAGVPRAERLAQVQKLIPQMLDHAEVARKLGISVSTVKNVLYDPDGSKQRKRRKRYQGRCEVCGKPTDGSNGRSKAPRFCLEHYNGSPSHLAQIAAMTVWTKELIISRIQEWAELYGEPPASADWNATQARYLGDEDRARRFEEGDGHWPWMPAVVKVFGSWNAAIEAAGFAPRCNTGGCGNSDRNRHQSEPEVRTRRRVEALRPLAADGVSHYSIAREMWEHWNYANVESCYHALFWNKGIQVVRPRRKPTDAEIAALREIP